MQINESSEAQIKADIGMGRDVELVCPVCQGSLEKKDDGTSCTKCSRNYGIDGEFLDLIVGGAYEDDKDCGCMEYESELGSHAISEYWIPLFKKIWPSDWQDKKILSVGCGTGVDIDTLCDQQFDAIGIDCGGRARVWNSRKHKGRLYLANGKNMPFNDGVFDAAFCGCVFPHVGTTGDTFTVADNFDQERQELAMEMTRVLKPGGKIIVSSPNRLFPMDLFHGRDQGGYSVRYNSLLDRFLLSVGDYRELFTRAGCKTVKTLPVLRYWNFGRSGKTFTGRLITFPIKVIFALGSVPLLGFLRASPLSPWIIVSATKKL